MNKTFLLSIILILALVLVTGCSSSQEDLPEDIQEELPENNALDTNDNGVDDVQVEVDEQGVTEVTINFDDVQDPELQAEIDANLGADFCITGETYSYSDGENDVDSEIIGLTMYKGSEFCQAQTTTTITANGMDIVTDTTYYFDNTYEEFWIISTISNSMMPEPTVSEIHLVNGEIQN
jgi:hypothetical protein